MSRALAVLAAPLFLCAAVALPASAAFHLVDINEVFTNADGSVQYVELRARNNNQTQLQGTRISALNADGTVTTLFFDFTAVFAWNAGDTLLVATPGFQAAAGFAPDFVAPSGSLISLTDGRVQFTNDAATTIVDAVAYGAYTGNNGTYGSPAQALPSDGCTSLSRIPGQEANDDNATSFQTVAGTPRRRDGTSTTLTCPEPEPPLAPVMGPAGQVLLVALLVGSSGLAVAVRRRSSSA